MNSRQLKISIMESRNHTFRTILSTTWPIQTHFSTLRGRLFCSKQVFDVFISRYNIDIVSSATGTAARLIVMLVRMLVKNVWKKVLVSSVLFVFPEFSISIVMFCASSTCSHLGILIRSSFSESSFFLFAIVTTNMFIINSSSMWFCLRKPEHEKTMQCMFTDVRLSIGTCNLLKVKAKLHNETLLILCKVVE